MSTGIPLFPLVFTQIIQQKLVNVQYLIPKKLFLTMIYPKRKKKWGGKGETRVSTVTNIHLPSPPGDAAAD